MNTITTSAFANITILAIDLGKYKSVACVHDQATGELSFTTLETTRAELQRLLDKHQPAVVIIDRTATRGLIGAPWTPLASLCCRGAADRPRSNLETLRCGD